MTAASSWKHSVRRVVIAQLVLAAFLAALFGIVKGGAFAVAAGFGGATAITGTLAAALRMALGAPRPGEGLGPGFGGVFQGAMLKFAVTVFLLVTGLVLFRLPPAAVIVGYLGASIGYLFARGYGAR
jgi:hypothetical protein